MQQWMAGLMVVAGVALSACTAASSAPTPAAAPTAPQAPTTAPTSAPTQVAQPVPTRAPQPATQTTQAAAPVTTQAQATTAQGGMTLVLDGQANQATYRAREQLVGRNLPSDAVGTTKNVKGRIVLSPSGEPVAEQSQITVDLSSLQSDERRRDNFIKTDTLQTNRFPTATFVARDIEGLAPPLPTSGEATFQLSGDLTVHGVTRPVTWQVTATFTTEGVSGNATTKVAITDFGMTPPRVGPVLSIDDELTLELNFAAAREA